MKRLWLIFVLIVCALCLWELFAYEDAHAGAPLPVERTQWPLWGNVELEPGTGIADCTFAAAADWEMAALHYQPRELKVVHEFYAAGGDPEDGIPEQWFEQYWAVRGIGGVRARMHYIGTRERRIKRFLDRDHYLLASAWNHEFLLTGYGPDGLHYVTYGEERTMPWSEWNREGEEADTVAVIGL